MRSIPVSEKYRGIKSDDIIGLPDSLLDEAHPRVLARPLESTGQLKSQYRLIHVSYLLQMTF